MSEFMILSIVFISMLILFYFLWVNGYMILNAKRALLFVGSLRWKNKCEVFFSSCSGYVKKVIKFNESREYTFKLDGDVSKGSIHVGRMYAGGGELTENIDDVAGTGTAEFASKAIDIFYMSKNNFRFDEL